MMKARGVREQDGAVVAMVWLGVVVIDAEVSSLGVEIG